MVLFCFEMCLHGCVTVHEKEVFMCVVKYPTGPMATSIHAQSCPVEAPPSILMLLSQSSHNIANHKSTLGVSAGQGVA